MIAVRVVDAFVEEPDPQELGSEGIEPASSSRPSVMYSDWDCALEGLPHPPTVRLGPLPDVWSVERLIAARRKAPFDAEDLARRVGLAQHEMKLLAAADALMSLSGHRRQQG